MNKIISLLFFTGLCFAQNYTGYPTGTFTSNLTGGGSGVVTSGTTVTLSWNVTIPGGDNAECFLYSRTPNGTTAGSASFGTPGSCNSSAMVTPTKTTYYELGVIDCGTNSYPCSGSSGSVGKIILRTPNATGFVPIIIGVGTNTLAATMSTASANNGPGVLATSPVGQSVQVTFTDSGAGLANYVIPAGSPTLPAGGTGTVYMPWADVWGWCTFTRESSPFTTVTVEMYYEGGKNAGNANAWKCNFNPLSVQDTWDFTATLADPTNYKTFSQTAIFKSIADTQYTGKLQLYSSSYPKILGTANGSPFYPLGMNFVEIADSGNNGVGNGNWAQSVGTNPPPITGGYLSQSPMGTVIGSYVDAGFNLISIEDDFTENVQQLGNVGGSGFSNYLTYGVGGTNGGQGNNIGGMGIDAAVMAAQKLHVKVAVSPESAPGNTFFNGQGTMNPFGINIAGNTALSATFAWFHLIDYANARWGAFADVMINGNEIGADAAWMASTDVAFKQSDPYGHLVSSGFNPTQLSDQNLDLNGLHVDVNTGIQTMAAGFATTIATVFGVQNKPYNAGEFSAQTPDDGIYFHNRNGVWSAFFQNASVTFYPSNYGNGTTTVGQTFIGTATQEQLSQFTTWVQNFDPTATALSVTSNGTSLNSYALASSNIVGVYLTTTLVSPANQTNPSVTFVMPFPGKCQWFNPQTGATLNSLMTVGSGTQTVQLTTTTFKYDALLGCWSTTIPVIYTNMLLSGVVGVSYSQTIAALGGAGGYGYTITAGGLPPGLSISGGVISGTPTQAGFWHFSMTATDSSSAVSVVQNFILPVTAPISLPMTISDGAANGYGGAIVVSGGAQNGSTEISCTVTGLPTGMSSINLCELSGAPVAGSGGNYTMAVTATDTSGNTATQNVTLNVPTSTTVNAAGTPWGITTANLLGCTTGYLYTTLVGENGAGGMISWQVESGSLPTGISIQPIGNSPITKTVSVAGLCPSSTATFSLTATTTSYSPPYNVSQAVSYTPTVNTPPVFATTSLTGYTLNTPYFQQLSCTGGTPPVWFELAPGSVLPSGMLLDEVTGALYGQISVGGTYPLTVNCWDLWHAGGPGVASASLSLAPALVPPPATASQPSGANRTVGDPF